MTVSVLRKQEGGVLSAHDNLDVTEFLSDPHANYRLAENKATLSAISKGCDNCFGLREKERFEINMDDGKRKAVNSLVTQLSDMEIKLIDDEEEYYDKKQVGIEFAGSINIAGSLVFQGQSMIYLGDGLRGDRSVCIHDIKKAGGGMHLSSLIGAEVLAFNNVAVHKGREDALRPDTSFEGVRGQDIVNAESLALLTGILNDNVADNYEILTANNLPLASKVVGIMHVMHHSLNTLYDVKIPKPSSIMSFGRKVQEKIDRVVFREIVYQYRQSEEYIFKALVEDAVVKRFDTFQRLMEVDEFKVGACKIFKTATRDFDDPKQIANMVAGTLEKDELDHGEVEALKYILKSCKHYEPVALKKIPSKIGFVDILLKDNVQFSEVEANIMKALLGDGFEGEVVFE